MVFNVILADSMYFQNLPVVTVCIVKPNIVQLYAYLGGLSMIELCTHPSKEVAGNMLGSVILLYSGSDSQTTLTDLRPLLSDNVKSCWS